MEYCSLLIVCLYYNKNSKQAEPAFCKKPWLKAVYLNLGGAAAASSTGSLCLLVPFGYRTGVALLWHTGGTSLPSSDAGVCVQMGFGHLSLLLNLVCDAGAAHDVPPVLTWHQSCLSTGDLAFQRHITSNSP